MKIAKKRYFILGILVFFFLIAAYFVKLSVGTDYGAVLGVVEERLLGIIIFHNPFILGLYFLIGIILIVRGIGFGKKKR